MGQDDNFRGLLYEPNYEHEVVILFSLLIPYFEDRFVIDKYPDTFPDCLARRNGHEIWIEFEVLVSDFYEHNHHEDPNLKKCSLLVCWENNSPWKTTTREDGVELLKPETVKGHYIEVMVLKKIIEKKSLKLILDSKRPDIDRANKERFFEQLKENVDETKYSWIKELHDQVNQREKEFEVKWGGGETWSSMRFYVKGWNVDPISVGGDGKVWINYQGNPAISPWELPKEVQTKLREIFRHHKEKWRTTPLDTQDDLDNIKRALEILAEYSKHFDIIRRE